MSRHWFFSNPQVHLKALFEVIFVTGCGLIGFLLLPFIRQLHHALNKSLPEIGFYDTISNGQLFPYCLGMVGGLMWLASQEFKGKGVPLRPIVNLVIWTTSAVCLIVYAIQPDLNSALPDNVIKISLIILAVYILINYYLLVIDGMPLSDIPQSLQAETDGMISRAKNRRGGAK